MLRISRILAPVLALAVLVGIVGIWDRLATGDLNLNYGSYVPWGLWVGLYVYLVGMSGGAFSVAFLHHGLGITALRRASSYAIPIALASLGAGLFLVLMDLGQLARFWHLYTRTNFGSPLGLMIWVYTLYAGVLVAMLVALARGSRALLKPLSIAGFALVLVFGGGEGALFGVLSSKPLWNSGLLPIRFLAGAFLSGVAIVTFAVVAFRRWSADPEEHEALGLLRLALLLLLGTNIVLEFTETSVALYGGVPTLVEAHRLIIFGPYWWVFWIVQIGMGLVLPAIVLGTRLGASRPWLGAASLLIAAGLAGAKQNIVLPALAIPEFRSLPEAFVHPRLSITYFPSGTEWAVALGAVAAAALAFVVAIEILPFLKEARSWGASTPHDQRRVP